MKNRILNIVIVSILTLLICTQFISHHSLYDGINVAKMLWLELCIALVFCIVAATIFLNFKRWHISYSNIDVVVIFIFLYSVIQTVVVDVNFLFTDKPIKYGLMFLLYIALRLLFQQIHRKDIYLNFFLLFLMISSSVQSIIAMLQLYGVLSSNNPDFPITGTFINPTPMAFGLAVVFPIAVYILVTLHDRIERIHCNKQKSNTSSMNSDHQDVTIRTAKSAVIFDRILYYTAISTIILILFVLPATMVRTAWIMAIVGSFLALLIKYKNEFEKFKVVYKQNKTIINIVIAVCLIASISGVYAIKKGSANGRILIWKVTAEKIQEAPLFGQGLGKFAAQYNVWQADWFKENPTKKDSWEGWVAGNVKFAYNEYLEILVEMGIIGLLLFALLFVLLFHRLSARNQFGSKNQKQEISSHFLNRLDDSLSNRNYHIPLIGIATILIGSLTSYVLFNLYTLILLVIFIAIGVSWPERQNIIKNNAYKIPLVTISILLAASLFVYLQKQIKGYQSYKYANKLASQTSYLYAIKEYKKAYPALKFNGVFLQYYAKALSLNKETEKSIDQLNKAGELNNDVYLFTSLGDNYKTLGDREKAIESYSMAENMQPNMLYPIYLQAKLHNETGDSIVAKELAKKALSKETKVSSQATEEMKDEMKMIINPTPDKPDK